MNGQHIVELKQDGNLTVVEELELYTILLKMSMVQEASGMNQCIKQKRLT